MQYEWRQKMVFNFFKKTDPICGMKQEKGKGIENHGEWFCNDSCLKEFEKKTEKAAKKQGSCCGH